MDPLSIDGVFHKLGGGRACEEREILTSFCVAGVGQLNLVALIVLLSLLLLLLLFSLGSSVWCGILLRKTIFSFQVL